MAEDNGGFFGGALKNIAKVARDTIGSFDRTPDQVSRLAATAAAGAAGRDGGARAQEAQDNFDLASRSAAMGGTFGDISQIPTPPDNFTVPGTLGAQAQQPFRDPQEILFESVFGPEFDPTTQVDSIEELQLRQQVFQTLQGLQQQREEQRIAAILRPFQLARELGQDVEIPPELLAEATGLPIDLFQQEGALDDPRQRLADIQEEQAFDSEVAQVFSADLSIPSIEAGRGAASGTRLAGSDPGRSLGDAGKIAATTALGGPFGFGFGMGATRPEDIADTEDIENYVKSEENAPGLAALDQRILERVQSGDSAQDVFAAIREAEALAGDAPQGFREWMLNRWLPVIQERNERIRAFEAEGGG
jgi:hypothetical protein